MFAIIALTHPAEPSGTRFFIFVQRGMESAGYRPLVDVGLENPAMAGMTILARRNAAAHVVSRAV